MTEQQIHEAYYKTFSTLLPWRLVFFGSAEQCKNFYRKLLKKNLNEN